MEILFRGKDAESGKWLYGWVFGEKAKSIIELDTQYVSKDGVEAYCTSVVIPETVGQYTGIDDKNGVKIFEGDVLRHTGTFEATAPAFFEYGCFWCQFGLWKERVGFFGGTLEVIGNIHDNPELLNG
jgi:uncharacterized phage protein (TIGR01671 family)